MVSYDYLKSFKTEQINCMYLCCVPLLKECPQHQGHKGDINMTVKTCAMFGKKTKVELVLDMEPWV
jgi:hypothetical protein